FKAAIRYTRYSADRLPENRDCIFSLGMSGGGAQSALIGSTSSSPLYTSCLQEIGAVEGVSDAVTGSMCWCPITTLDMADEAYEWSMGNTRT
ncbi:MAG: tannase, partial [Aristaeellaceae bacterium]